MAFEEQFCQCVVRNAACVLAGIKPAALFNFIPRRPQECATCSCERLCDAQVRRQAAQHALEFTRTYGSRGIRCDVLMVGRGRALMLVSRSQELANLVDQADVAAFLQQAGFDVAGPRQLVRSLRIKMTGFERRREAAGGATSARIENTQVDAASASMLPSRPCACIDDEPPTFPHEVGVLLGYPLADVLAFIAHDGRDELACGVWKAYIDPEGAQACWQAMRECRSQALARYRTGATLSELIA